MISEPLVIFLHQPLRKEFVVKPSDEATAFSGQDVHADVADQESRHNDWHQDKKVNMACSGEVSKSEEYYFFGDRNDNI